MSELQMYLVTVGLMIVAMALIGFATAGLAGAIALSGLGVFIAALVLVVDRYVG